METVEWSRPESERDVTPLLLMLHGYGSNELLAAMEPLAVRMPFLWARDPADLLINPDATRFAAEWLAANTEFVHARYPGSFVPRG
ncbi:hypothetical protein AAGW05_04440 [Arthrobacter sp. LAPM80]|uniref:hypothetical protein n=1 Tax=Arthrobacter sp. LAPM80 TaxID=3141788 RepID=UPI00398B57ED